MFQYSMTDEVLLESYIESSYGFSESLYGEGKLIRCRATPKYTLVRRENGVDVDSNFSYLTQTQVNIQDRIDGHIVLGVKALKDVLGNTVMWEVYV